jgi:sec-independent protein translocase protein TatA
LRQFAAFRQACDPLLNPLEGATRRVAFVKGVFTMLNNIGLPGLLLIAVVVLVLLGRGKISSLMGEVGKGITAFKKGVNDGTKELEEEAAEEAKDVTPADEKDKV